MSRIDAEPGYVTGSLRKLSRGVSGSFHEQTRAGETRIVLSPEQIAAICGQRRNLPCVGSFHNAGDGAVVDALAHNGAAGGEIELAVPERDGPVSVSGLHAYCQYVRIDSMGARIRLISS